MSESESETPTAIRGYLLDAVRVLANAAHQLCRADLSVDEYSNLARICAGLSMMLSTHAQHLQRNNLIIPEGTATIDAPDPDQP
jgi:hypothetical protein